MNSMLVCTQYVLHNDGQNTVGVTGSGNKDEKGMAKIMKKWIMIMYYQEQASRQGLIATYCYTAESYTWLLNVIGYL